MNADKLREILNKHSKWRRGGVGGERADLRGADLRSVNLRYADLGGAYLRGAYLRGADLRDADLRDADLGGANLRGANLRGADLRYADLRGANLRGADLRDADLRDADLRDADLRGARGCLCLPVGDPRSYRPVAIWCTDAWRIFAGCRSFTIEEARRHWGSDEYPDTNRGAQYVAAMDWLEKQEGTS